jgi:pyridoxal phosphate enzyme (YggS family)
VLAWSLVMQRRFAEAEEAMRATLQIDPSHVWAGPNLAHLQLRRGAVEEAIASGQRVFGENRVQEALSKYPALRKAHPDIELHLIGPLQTNKVRDAVALFDVIQTVDRPKLAAALAMEMEKTGRQPRCFVQINTGEEPQKAGILPGEADAFIAAARETHRLPVEGLMCIPPVDEEPALHFALLREIARRNGVASLSMGMSGDFEVAIRFGATHVRVGTAIFGVRPTKAE